MKQIITFDDELRGRIFLLENNCEKIAEHLKDLFSNQFPIGSMLVIDVVRTRKGKIVDTIEIFEDDYESFLEIGIEIDGDYFPNAQIPLWKCKVEWLQKTGYLTDRNETEIETTLNEFLKEMLEENANGRDI